MNALKHADAMHIVHNIVAFLQFVQGVNGVFAPSTLVLLFTLPGAGVGKQGKANIRNLHPAAKAARAYMHRAGLKLLRQARVEFCGKALTLQVRGQGAPGSLRTCQQADGVLFLRQGAQLLRQLGHGAAPYPQGLQPEVGQMPHRGVKAAPRHGVQIQRFLFCINFRQRVKINRIPVQPLAQAALLHQPLHILLQQPIGVIALLFHFCRIAHRQQTVAIIKQSVGLIHEG